MHLLDNGPRFGHTPMDVLMDLLPPKADHPPAQSFKLPLALAVTGNLVRGAVRLQAVDLNGHPQIHGKIRVHSGEVQAVLAAVDGVLREESHVPWIAGIRF